MISPLVCAVREPAFDALFVKPRLEIRCPANILLPVRFHSLSPLLAVVAALFVFSPARAAQDVVAILANSSDPDSLVLARHYAAARGVPEANIVALPMPATEQITWPEFVSTIWNPLLREMVERDWFLAALSDRTDAVGRLVVTPSGHKLRALVICRGVPLRVAHDAALYDEKSNPLTSNSALRNNEGAVDSELALVAAGNPPIAAFVPNPLFDKDDPPSLLLDQVVVVGRLDGPTLDDAKALVDNALLAERDGIAGRAYVDIGGPHKQGDDWFAACVPELQKLGFETDVDRAKSTLSVAARFDAPVLYFGWYAGDLNGPFGASDFRFPTGAIALHIHSFSARTLRSPAKGWTGPLVAKGVTATFGNVGEPYLQFTHQPHVFLKALARGEPLGRAALGSINALSWKGVLVGDPLYQPFAVSSEAQWARRKELPPETEAYARIRRMRLLAAEGRTADAIALGDAGLTQNPTLPLALSLADLQKAAGRSADAKRTLGIFGGLRRIRASDRALAMDAARAAASLGDNKLAYKLADALLSDGGLPRELRIAALLAGCDYARAVGETSQASSWAVEHARLTSPPPTASAEPANKK